MFELKKRSEALGLTHALVNRTKRDIEMQHTVTA